MIGRHRKAYPSGCSAASTAELASIDAAEVYYTAMADAALVNANSNADSVYNYTAAALPAQLTVSIAGINSAPCSAANQYLRCHFGRHLRH